MTEEEQSCEEDYCSSHGRGLYDPEEGCVCECDPQEWIGERCDIRSPCAGYSCMNSSNCTLKEHPQEKAVEAICVCPNGTELLKTTISGEFFVNQLRSPSAIYVIILKGDHCEKIETDDEKSLLIPCRKDHNYRAWYQQIHGMIKGNDRKNLEEIDKSCIEIDGSKCARDGVLRGVPSGKRYLVPFCECKDADSGRFCEEIVFASMETATRIPPQLVNSPVIVDSCFMEEIASCGELLWKQTLCGSWRISEEKEAEEDYGDIRDRKIRVAIEQKKNKDYVKLMTLVNKLQAQNDAKVVARTVPPKDNRADVANVADNAAMMTKCHTYRKVLESHHKLIKD
ncbi:hypothetical protein NECAME_05377 [Necator americanus]|uniref:EGF-like domain-containing protein n=1 Tax=Necator americanus TaxID=51031 RepID=W2SJJ2_NECAM|nr:hypothetical protein NECAME_05377 [Necator americanus]ETN68922.1 hypothetical protein NECAME_05377 [Necator americanus]